MREIVLDTETTGLEPSQGHRIIEIGCLELNNRTPTGAKYHVYINPQRDVPEEAQKISNLSTEFLQDKPLFADVVDGFIEFIADSPLVIHNAEFDIKFLNSELTKAKRPTLPLARAIDTVHIARKKFPGSPASLDALCRRFNISLDERKSKGHGAMLDVELLAQVYLELLGGKQPGLELVAKSTGTSGVVLKRQPATPRSVALPSRLSDDERSRHDVLIASLGDKAIWKN
jgi:DNA polymerase III subunit epsilon